ncbi:CASP8 and FADD-like apoptosis regulator [Syngnathoides biaculeatus]|uniref:CASP8 and FADD-like apoptosis regulator n=1 Tax=Syngnathoides biaculeatus TaxID=300417 RepID=UPI002ADE4E0B|nr:CASP8 and FADD-like apoptosis regulator [Syngnathoides biaculeatus]
MAQISEDMSKDDVSSVKFLLGHMLPRFPGLGCRTRARGEGFPNKGGPFGGMFNGRRQGRPGQKAQGVQDVSQCASSTRGSDAPPLPGESSRYTLTSDPRGECVIIDCVGNDGEMMAHAFKSLHFNVTLHKWLNLIETVSTLRKVFQRSPDRSGDGFVCCIISRVMDNRLQATDMNCEGLRLEDVRRFFNGDACPALVGKPKLFFIQSYTVSKFQPCAVENHCDDCWEMDGGAGQLRPDCLPSDADVLWSHCSTGEHQLQRGRHRSVYLKALTDALGRSQGRSRHLVDLHMEVNGAIFEHNSRHREDQYHIDLKNTLRKDLYL